MRDYTKYASVPSRSRRAELSARWAKSIPCPSVSTSWFRTPETLFFTRVSWEPLLSIRAARRGLKIAEIPGDEPPRIGGERKLQVWKWGAAYYFQFWRDFLLWR